MIVPGVPAYRTRSANLAVGMWGQLSSLGQVLKESAENVAREAGLDQQLVSGNVARNTTHGRYALHSVHPHFLGCQQASVQDQAQKKVGSQLGSLLAYEGQNRRSPGKQVPSMSALFRDTRSLFLCHMKSRDLTFNELCRHQKRQQRPHTWKLLLAVFLMPLKLWRSCLLLHRMAMVGSSKQTGIFRMSRLTAQGPVAARQQKHTGSMMYSPCLLAHPWTAQHCRLRTLLCISN